MRIYYKPDSDADVSRVELELKGKSYTYKQSKKLWRLKGREWTEAAAFTRLMQELVS